MPAVSAGPRLLAVSDLHVTYLDNRRLLDGIRPQSDGDWLLVAGDVAELSTDVEWTLRLLRERFAVVIWTPGNHELWTHPKDPIQLRGEERYRYLVKMCQSLDVTTPEDPYPIWEGPGGPVQIAPLFVLYDYSFIPPGLETKAAALARADETGMVCTDELLLHPDPYPSREAWCWARVEATERRLAELRPSIPAVLVGHFPLIRQPTLVLAYPEFAQWCGTTRTAGWHIRFNATVAVYGHLHIPGTHWHDGVRFEEVSYGYPWEWAEQGAADRVPRQILPAADDPR